MRDQVPQPSASPITLGSVILERVSLYTVEQVDEYLAARISKNLKIAEYDDAFEFRRRFTGFGQAARQTLRCPSTWVQHLKLALRTRWPRLFGRLIVRFDEASIEGGAIVTGLKDKLEDRRANRYVVPWTAPERRRQYVDDPTKPEDE